MKSTGIPFMKAISFAAMVTLLSWADQQIAHATPSMPSGGSASWQVSQPTLLGETVSTNGYRYGFAPFVPDGDTNTPHNRYLQQVDAYNSPDLDPNDVWSVDTNGTKHYENEVSVYQYTTLIDRYTGSNSYNNPPPLPSGMGYCEFYAAGDSNGVFPWVTNSEMVITRRGHEDFDGTNPPPEVGTETITLSQPYTATAFKSYVEGRLPAFSNNLTQWVNSASKYLDEPEELNYSLTKLQYKWQVNAVTNDVVTWDEQFQQQYYQDGGGNWVYPPVLHKILSWVNTSGTTNSPVYTIDPLHYTNADGTMQTNSGSWSVGGMSVSLAVDANRDGTIDPGGSDQTSQTRPYRFWVNPQTTGVGTIFNSEAELTQPNLGVMNLENFARLGLNMDWATWNLINSGNIQIALKWKSITNGSPAINIYPCADSSGSLSYLTDGYSATNQISGSNNNTLGTISGSSPLMLSSNNLTNYWNTTFLFEATGLGSGQLEVVFLDKNGNQVAEGPSVWMNLVDIKSMYQQWQATPTTLPPPYNDAVNPPADVNNSGYQLMLGRPVFQKALDETNSVFVFVNGSNESVDYSTTTAETLFKRLYWLGYKGRVVSFRWETLVGLGDGTVPAQYNLNEWMAWTWGEGLRKFMVSASIPSNYSKYVGSHSLGAGVISSALQRGMAPDAVFFMQAALPAGCFDSSGNQNDPNSVNGFADMWAVEATKPTPDTSLQLGYRGFVSSSVPIYSFYNDNDFALTRQSFNLGGWEGNQEGYKPDQATLYFSGLNSWQYIYDSSTSAGHEIRLVYPNIAARFITSPYESMAFVSRSRSKALGALATGGVISENINVGEGSPTNLQNGRDDHGGEFHRPLNQVMPFYQEILDRIP